MELNPEKKSAPAPRLEVLESRTLMSVAWGNIPLRVGQVASLTAFPRVTGAGMSVAVIDTGINYNLPQLGGGFGAGHKVIAGWNFVNNNANPMDTDGHGTGVASVIAATSYFYQGKRYIGVAPNANLIALKVDDGIHDPPASRFTAALLWVLNNRTRYNIVGVNISDGNAPFPTRRARVTYMSLLQQLKANNVFVSAASGNEGQVNGVDYPASDPSAVAVGSVNASDRVSNFSDSGRTLDLLAPGEGVPVLYLDNGRPVVIPANGTSFAAPFAVGTAVLMRQVNSRLTVDNIVTRLQQTGTPVRDWRTGGVFSRVNVYAAVRSAARG